MMVVCEQMQQLRKLLDEKNIPWEDRSEDMTHDKEWPMWFCNLDLMVEIEEVLNG